MDASGRIWQGDSVRRAAKEVRVTVILGAHELGLDRQDERSQSPTRYRVSFGGA